MRLHREDNTPFLDLLFITVLIFLALFYLSFLLIRPIVEKQADIETQAEYVITVTWDKDCPDDVDTWLRTPTGRLIWFRQKENALCHLDRDDLGCQTDYIELATGERIEYPYNQEITTIRGHIPGEWVLNVHMYHKRSSMPTTVTIRMDALNPCTSMILHKELTITEHWREYTIARFTMGEKDILTWDDTPANLVKYDELPTQYSHGTGVM